MEGSRNAHAASSCWAIIIVSLLSLRQCEVFHCMVKHMPSSSVCAGEWIATWLILPVVIRSSQRLSHACLSINLLL